MQRLSIPEPGYYTYQASDFLRFVVLDTTEMSGHSNFPKDSWQVKEAEAFLQDNPFSVEDRPHMVSWNGGITKRQHAWLKEQLKAAEQENKYVIVAAHHQVCPGASRKTHLAWNYEDILTTITSSRAVLAFFAGHDHEGGYVCHRSNDGNIIHFCTIPAILEAAPGSNSYAVLDVTTSNAPCKHPTLGDTITGHDPNTEVSQPPSMIPRNGNGHIHCHFQGYGSIVTPWS